MIAKELTDLIELHRVYNKHVPSNFTEDMLPDALYAEYSLCKSCLLPITVDAFDAIDGKCTIVPAGTSVTQSLLHIINTPLMRTFAREAKRKDMLQAYADVIVSGHAGLSSRDIWWLIKTLDCLPSEEVMAKTVDKNPRLCVELAAQYPKLTLRCQASIMRGKDVEAMRNFCAMILRRSDKTFLQRAETVAVDDFSKGLYKRFLDWHNRMVSCGK